MWNEFNWIELMPEIKGIAKVDEEAVKTIISRGLAAKAPARTFRKLTSVPFLPPTLQVAEIIKKKCNTRPNPDTEWLQKQARRYLPQPTSAARTDRTMHRRRHTQNHRALVRPYRAHQYERHARWDGPSHELLPERGALPRRPLAMAQRGRTAQEGTVPHVVAPRGHHHGAGQKGRTRQLPETT